jgi:hypothetical protein
MLNTIFECLGRTGIVIMISGSWGVGTPTTSVIGNFVAGIFAGCWIVAPFYKRLKY